MAGLGASSGVRGGQSRLPQDVVAVCAQQLTPRVPRGRGQWWRDRPGAAACLGGPAAGVRCGPPAPLLCLEWKGEVNYHPTINSMQ